MSARSLVPSAVLLVFALPLAAQPKLSDWPQFRGPGGTGVSPDKGLPVKWDEKENVVWRVEPGSGNSSPVIVGKRIFLTGYSGFNEPGKKGEMQQLKLHVHCLDRDTGKTVWTKDVEPSLPEQEKIRDEHGYASATPVVDDERVYAFFGKSGVHAFTLDGKFVWKADVGSKLNGWGSAASPILSGEHVIINASVESESLVALDRKTGKEAWRAKGIKESWNTPIVHGNEIVVAIMGKVLGIDPADGRQLWSCATDIAWYMVPSMVADSEAIYCIGGRTAGGLAVRGSGKGDVTKTHRLWTVSKGSNVSSPVLHGGHLYWMHEVSGVAYCAEAKTGKIVYEQRIDRMDQVYAAAVLGDGKIYYVNRTGATAVVAAKPEFELLGMNRIGQRGHTFNASPSIAGGKLYIRSDRALYCIGGK